MSYSPFPVYKSLLTEKSKSVGQEQSSYDTKEKGFRLKSDLQLCTHGFWGGDKRHTPIQTLLWPQVQPESSDTRDEADAQDL